MVRRWRDLSVGRKVAAPYFALTLLVGMLISAFGSRNLATTGAEQTSVTLGICLAAVLLTAVVGGIVSRSITHPIENLVKATSEVAKGHFDYRAKVEASDEIGRLTASFNQMVAILAERTGQLQRFSDETLMALAAAIDARDPYTHGHSIRVAAYSHVLARGAGLDDAHIDAIRRGCLVHDIGKIGVRDSILRKQGPLSASELAEMREHPLVGYRMLQRLEWDQAVFDVVLHHHERWDGGGYPVGLAADAVPVVARVVAIADALDAMTSQRPYRSALSYAEAVDEIGRQSGVQFDPALVKVFRAARQEIGRLIEVMSYAPATAKDTNPSATRSGPLLELPAVS